MTINLIDNAPPQEKACREALLPCPFCGGEAHEAEYEGSGLIACGKCGVEAYAEAWNTRAHSARLSDPAVVEVVARASYEATSKFYNESKGAAISDPALVHNAIAQAALAAIKGAV